MEGAHHTWSHLASKSSCVQCKQIFHLAAQGITALRQQRNNVSVTNWQ